MQDIQFKANTGQFNIDQAQGIVECFVAGIGNKDSVGDIVVTGAFAKSLMRRKPRVVWGHNWNDPIGKVLEIYEVPPNDPRLPTKMKMAGIGGLYAKVQFNLNSEKGREAFANVAFFGEEQEWSIGYKTLDAIYDNSRQANILREVELYEVSPVLHGANQLTGTISVKSDEEKMHMMMGVPGMVAVHEKPKAPTDPFEMGIAQPVDSDRMAALERELSSRTGSPVKVMKANESSVVFIKPGKGLFRLAYYFDGEQYMFGKPEKISAPVMPQIVQRPMREGRPPQFGMPSMATKPNVNPSVMQVRYGDEDNSSSMIFGGVRPKDTGKSLEDEIDLLLNEKSELPIEKLREVLSTLHEIVDQPDEFGEYVIKCSPENAFSTKQALDPVFDYHRLETYVTEDGIVVSSPMTSEAYEAVETATKSLIGRIGRAVGGGGKARRGRAALSRIEGVLDPSKRRDHDNDGLIFDGTPYEQPARRINKPEQVTGLVSRREEGAAQRRSKKPTFDYSKPRKDIVLTRPEQKKLADMFSEVIAENGVSENSPLRQVADAINNAVAIGEGRVPDISPDLFDAFKKDYESVKDAFQRAGAKKEGQRGRSPFEILDEFVKKGSYKRTNLGTDARTAKGQRTMSGKRPGRVEIPASSRAEIVERFLPDSWQKMQPDEKFDWWFSNVAKLQERSNSQRWRSLLNSIEEEIVKDEEDFERRNSQGSGNRALQRRRSQLSPDELGQIRERMEESAGASRSGPKKPQRQVSAPEDNGNRFSSSGRAILTYIDKNKNSVSEEFESAVRKAIEEMDASLTDNDGQITEQNLKDAQDAIEKVVDELQQLAAQRRKKARKLTSEQAEQRINMGEDESAATRREQELIAGMRKLSEALGADYQRMNRADTERELNPEEDILERAGRAGARGGAGDDDNDYESLQSLDEIQLTSMRQASNYRSARDRRKQGTGLLSRRDDSNRAPRTEVIAESTWWKSVIDSIPKEIRETDDDSVRDGLKLLKDTLERQESGAFKPGSKRTNVGSLRITAQEADMILDSVMAVVDRQMTAGRDGGVGSRAEIFAELLEKISKASMSTFINKTSGPADERRKRN